MVYQPSVYHKFLDRQDATELGLYVFSSLVAFFGILFILRSCQDVGNNWSRHSLLRQVSTTTSQKLLDLIKARGITQIGYSFCGGLKGVKIFTIVMEE